MPLKAVGGTPGDATAKQMDQIADLADKYSFGEIRVGHEQNLALPHVAQRDLPTLWRALDQVGVATANGNGETVIGLVQMLAGENALDVATRAREASPAPEPTFAASAW